MVSGVIVAASISACGHAWSLTGQSWMEKVAEVRKELVEEGAAALVVTALDEVACEYVPVGAYCLIYHCLYYRVVQPTRVRYRVQSCVLLLCYCHPQGQ